MTLSLAEFTEFYCQRPANFAWFLGAGASRSAGLPTASDLIWILKLRYYCRTENQDIDRQDLQLDSVKAKIQSYMDSLGFPAEWADDEYTSYFEKVFGEDRELQRRFLAWALKEKDVRLSIGNRVFGALLAGGYCKAAFTTNFDSVVERAVADVSGRSLSAFHLEGSSAAQLAVDNEEFPVYCKLHGDYRFQSLKNLSADLVEQNKNLSKCLLNACSRFGLIVSGYSGRDKSVMDLFAEVLETSNPFPHGLFWTGMKGAEVPESVFSLIEKAKVKGVKASYVEVETFDSLMLRLWRNIENKPTDLDRKVRRTQVASTSIPLPVEGGSKPLIRMNALPISSWTSQCLKLALSAQKEWKDLRDAERNSSGALILTKDKDVWCWGTEEAVSEEFGAELVGIEHCDIGDRFDNFHSHLNFQSFFLEGICKAIVRGRPLLSRSGKGYCHLIVDGHSEDLPQLAGLFSAVGKIHGKIPGLYTVATSEHPVQTQIEWAESVRVSLEQKSSGLWLTLDPDIWIWPKRARSLARSFLDERRKSRLNAKYNQLLDGWIEAIFGTSQKNTELSVSPFSGGDGAENPTFIIRSRTGYSLRRTDGKF